MSIKDIIKRLSLIGLEVNYALDDGISFLGFNISRARHPFSVRSSVALSRCLALHPASVLDVGSGGGLHASTFAMSGSDVTCIDFGTSVYALNRVSNDAFRVINTDFNRWFPEKKYDLVWASHVLEHQRNVGNFLEKLIECCHPNGKVAVIVPSPHRKLWGGHLTLWSPGLLAYNIVLCGVDLSDAEIFYGYREIAIIFSPKYVDLPDLSFDKGDLNKLRHFLPEGFVENSDAWL